MTKSQCVKILATIGIVLAAFFCAIVRADDDCPTYTCPKHGEITYCDVIYLGCDRSGPYCLKCMAVWLEKHAQKVKVE